MDSARPLAKDLSSFAELTSYYVRDVDYRVRTRIDTDSEIAVIAPHGGEIENMTSEITDGICRDAFSYYLFEGMLSYGSYRYLHLTSTKFDDPVCLKVIAQCASVVSIHGCKGAEPEVLIGGRDHLLKEKLADGLRDAGVSTRTEGHQFPGIHPRNICNRGATGKGVQLEFTDAIRNTHAELLGCAVRSIRSTLSSTISG